MVALVVLQIIVDDVVGFVIAAVEFDVVFLEKGISEQLVGCTDTIVFGGEVFHMYKNLRKSYILSSINKN